jgi:hypothetical protein
MPAILPAIQLKLTYALNCPALVVTVPKRGSTASPRHHNSPGPVLVLVAMQLNNASVTSSNTDTIRCHELRHAVRCLLSSASLSLPRDYVLTFLYRRVQPHVWVHSHKPLSCHEFLGCKNINRSENRTQPRVRPLILAGRGRHRRDLREGRGAVRFGDGGGGGGGQKSEWVKWRIFLMGARGCVIDDGALQICSNTEV